MSKHQGYLTALSDRGRHYCPKSEAYTGVDSLLSAFYRGWLPSQIVYRHQVWRGSRPVNIYYFELRHNDELMTMPIIENPHVVTLIEKYELSIITRSEEIVESTYV